ncbi:MAG TPA: PocR ligand-binding domain-containing protein, partial [Polyangiaceae bacterium]|nr:PocR ligand-binding domain-containing protein [Polyangiaceae bacterium]
LSGAAAGLRQLLDATSLEEVISSFFSLFQIPIRVLADDGRSLAKNRRQPALHEYLSALPGAAQRLGELYEELRRRPLGDEGHFAFTCFTGARYHVTAVAYDGRNVGRVVLGPYLPPETAGLSSELAKIPGLDTARAVELSRALPRVREDTVRAIARHLGVILDALIFAGHKSWLTEVMHLSSVQEGFRELAAKVGEIERCEQRIAELGRQRSRLLLSVADDLGDRRRPLMERLGQQRANAHEAGGAGWERIGKDAARLEDLETRLRELASLESGELGVRELDVDVAELLERTRGSIQAPTGAGVELDMPLERLPNLRADPELLERALTLLGEQALRVGAGARGGAGPLRLQFGARLLGDGSDASDGLVLLGAAPQSCELRVAVSRATDATLPPAPNPLDWAWIERVVQAHGGALRIDAPAPSELAFVLTLPVERPSRSL